ncbi:MAG: CAP domain-containing protein [Phenylobacterium sp.]|uniref:CAP domain-containing protein n=1 Tax=Phenylobacterium sp. TaxID=1871053 RepID=UPI001A3E1314|nr:CAP domain-containing protein [Phenylobacterium sp.]MBL8553654.1 CAP domain-containing protein [Phenylobacterium sp.]
MSRPSRRTALATALAAVAAPAAAEAIRDAAPPASDAAAWSAYEGRLRDRIADAGGGRFDDAAAREALVLSNAARTAAGAPALAWHDDLEKAARAHAGDLARRGYVEHLSPEGFDPSHRFWLLSRRVIGSPSENIGYHSGPGSPVGARHFMDQWRKSPGHWRNMLRASHTHGAFAMVRGPRQAVLVGLYVNPLAELAEPLPFHARGQEIGRAIRSLPPEARPRLSVPQGSRLGEVDGTPPVMQLTAVRLVEVGRFDVIGGPIFLAAGGA